MLLRHYDYNNLPTMVEPIFSSKNVEEMLGQYPGIVVTYKDGKSIYFFYNIDAFHLVGPVDLELRDFSKNGMRVIENTWEGYTRYENRYYEAINDFCDSANKYIKEGNATVTVEGMPSATIVSSMKRITAPNEFEGESLYWARSKKDGHIETAVCIPVFIHTKVIALVSEIDHLHPDYHRPDHFLNMYDVVGPIPSMTKEEFQICFNKDPE